MTIDPNPPPNEFTSPFIRLHRKVGRLHNRSAFTDADNEVWFRCECECGRWRSVKRKQFNNGNVNCCEWCAENGGWTDMAANHTPRAQLGLETEPLALLGFDLELGKPSGTALRSLIREFGDCVKETELPFIEPEWAYLRQRVLAEPELLNDGTPKGRLLRIVEGKDGLHQMVLELNPLQVLAVLSALRWVVQHPDDQQWWRPEHRTGDE